MPAGEAGRDPARAVSKQGKKQEIMFLPKPMGTVLFTQGFSLPTNVTANPKFSSRLRQILHWLHRLDIMKSKDKYF